MENFALANKLKQSISLPQNHEYVDNYKKYLESYLPLVEEHKDNFEEYLNRFLEQDSFKKLYKEALKDIRSKNEVLDYSDMDRAIQDMKELSNPKSIFGTLGKILGIKTKDNKLLAKNLAQIRHTFNFAKKLGAN